MKLTPEQEAIAREAANVLARNEWNTPVAERIISDAIARALTPVQAQAETSQSNAELWHEELMKADKRLLAQSEDAARLEWLETHGEVAINRYEDGSWDLEVCCPAISSNGSNAREAIDAARKEQL